MRNIFTKASLMTNSKQGIAFMVLLITFLGCLFFSFRSIFSEERSINSNLAAYDCGRYKNTSIHNHVVTLEDGLRFQIASSNLRCEQVRKPIVGLAVSLIVKRNKLLSLSQDGKEILIYSILKEDSDRSTAILLMVTTIIFFSLLWSGFKISRNHLN